MYFIQSILLIFINGANNFDINFKIAMWVSYVFVTISFTLHAQNSILLHLIHCRYPSILAFIDGVLFCTLCTK
jgi:hypothetical protein